MTSALPYAYSIPHLGNFVGSILPADVYFKYLKMCEKDAIFICGSDQHGTPIELRAIKEKTTPDKLSNEMHAKIKAAFEKLGCTFTFYGKTHTEENKSIVYSIFEALTKNGYIAETHAEHAYCNFDKRFLVDRFIEGTCPFCKSTKARGDQCDDCGRLLDPIQLIDPHCMICGKSEVSFRKVKNLALDLGKLQPAIAKFIMDSSTNGWSRNALNKSSGSIREGLKARDITRNMEWGFPVPVKGFENNVFYVWFDAIIGYIGISKEWSNTLWDKYWMDPKAKLIQFMGKDNIEFHTIMWPGVLLGSTLGFTMPHTIKAYEYLTSKSIKFSKSRGIGLNVETALSIAEADYWRFALIGMLPETSDSEFNAELFDEQVNKIMNGKIGNLIHRVLTIARSNIKLLPVPVEDNYPEVAEIVKNYSQSFDNIRLRDAQKAIIDLAELGNSLINATEPWALAKAAAQDKEKAKEFANIMGKLIRIIYSISIMLHPFSPEASANAMGYFKVGSPSIHILESKIELDLEIPLAPIFHRVEVKNLAKFA